jgi:hypothetical protein
MDVTCKMDYSGVNRGVAAALMFSKRTPAQLCNTVGLEVAINTKFNMPFVTIERIDTELNVLTVPVIGKRGKPLKKKKNYAGQVGTQRSPEPVPLAVLIVQARANGLSRYNGMTGGRYFGPSPFKGVSPAQGRDLMRAAVSRMIKTRHSSTKFLMAGWVDCVRDLLPLSVNRYRRGGGHPPMEGAKNHYGADLGGATPAREGEYNVFCIIENRIGYEGKNAASFDHALQLRGGPVLQAALDNEGRRQMDYFLMKSAQEQLVKPFNDACR